MARITKAVQATRMRAVVTRIKRMPKRLEMDDWAGQESCGTVACYAGHCAWGTPDLRGIFTKLVKLKKSQLRDERNAWNTTLEIQEQVLVKHVRKYLGLSEEQADRIFYMCGWPREYVIDYNTAALPQQRVAALEARIEHFLETGK